MTHVDRIIHIPTSWHKPEDKFKVLQHDKNQGKDKEPNDGSNKKDIKKGSKTNTGRSQDGDDSGQSHIDEYA